MYTVLGCLLCKYNFPHSFSYLLNGLWFASHLNLVIRCAYKNVVLTECINMRLWHCRTDWLLLEIHRSTDTSDRPHCNFVQVTCGTTVHSYALVASYCSKFQERVCLVKKKMSKDIISTFVSGHSAEDFGVNPWKKQNVLVSGLPKQSS